MRATALTIAALLVAGASNAQAQTPAPVYVPNGFVDRLTLSRWNEDDQQTYVMGVVDGILVSGLLNGKNGLERDLHACMTSENVTSIQIRLTTLKIINDEPEKLNDYAHVAVLMALEKICPRLKPRTNS